MPVTVNNELIRVTVAAERVLRGAGVVTDVLGLNARNPQHRARLGLSEHRQATIAVDILAVLLPGDAIRSRRAFFDGASHNDFVTERDFWRKTELENSWRSCKQPKDRITYAMRPASEFSV